MMFKPRVTASCQSIFGKLLSMALALMLAASFAQAETYVSTLGPVDPDIELSVLNDLMTGFAFTTDSQAYRIDSITARFIVGAIASPLVGLDLGAKIFAADSSGYPISETALGTFSHPSLSVSNLFDVVFTPSGNIELAADSTYIFVISPVNSDVVGFGWYGTEAVPPDEGWNVVNGIFNKDGLEPWNEISGGEYVAMASVEATAIPEPSTWVFLGGACALVVWPLRRRSAA